MPPGNYRSHGVIIAIVIRGARPTGSDHKDPRRTLFQLTILRVLSPELFYRRWGTWYSRDKGILDRVFNHRMNGKVIDEVIGNNERYYFA